MRIKATYNSKYLKRKEEFYIGEEIDDIVYLNRFGWIDIYHNDDRIRYELLELFNEDWNNVLFTATFLGGFNSEPKSCLRNGTTHELSPMKFPIKGQECEIRIIKFGNHIHVVDEDYHSTEDTKLLDFTFIYDSFEDFNEDWK